MHHFVCVVNSCNSSLLVSLYCMVHFHRTRTIYCELYISKFGPIYQLSRSIFILSLAFFQRQLGASAIMSTFTIFETPCAYYLLILLLCLFLWCYYHSSVDVKGIHVLLWIQTMVASSSSWYNGINFVVRWKVGTWVEIPPLYQLLHTCF